MRLREGDIVSVRIRVTKVADYGDEQQILGEMLPNGANVGWLIPKEVKVYLHEATLRKDDRVKFGVEDYEILMIDSKSKSAVVRKIGEWPIRIAALDKLTRI